jgi:hypothetical protein
MRYNGSMKSKMMKRLPENWGELLTLDDVREIQAHFAERVAYWLALKAEDHHDADRNLRILARRTDMWQQVYDAKIASTKCMHIIRAFQATEPGRLDGVTFAPEAKPVKSLDISEGLFSS